ncbi:hypothetical protein EXU57_14690 [Segetibacter sp. 3557_3]|uniref:hypothetical protein n=1 Tax=Segetibacter sp. 3557_3 TaxID=2547429 RepID=UPI0010590DCE|nr:hypothetical protein [Segetibacter sp. 3557_3]TDH24585.1 hypothetical protein EXU57_14690 [Segetibacter sp. 3557_3]
MKHSIANFKEDPSVNTIESVYELISENVFDNPVPESDEDDIETISPTVDLYFDVPLYSRLQILDFPTEYFPNYPNTLSLAGKEPHSPPPKRA